MLHTLLQAAPPCPCSYGWLLPAGAAGQGRGTRSFVHVTKASALMHDASYLCPLLLRWVVGRGCELGINRLAGPALAECPSPDA